ncbi:MAG: hypothetical protein ACK42C_09785, partial [Aquificaceae bacterium]
MRKEMQELKAFLRGLLEGRDVEVPWLGLGIEEELKGLKEKLLSLQEKCAEDESILEEKLKRIRELEEEKERLSAEVSQKEEFFKEACRVLHQAVRG